MFRYHLKENAFKLIKNGLKSLEGRLNKNTFKKIKIGDIINFHNNKEDIFVKIISINHYSSFMEALKNEDIKKLNPLSESIKQSINIYRNCYPIENEIKYGVIIFQIELINNPDKD